MIYGFLFASSLIRPFHNICCGDTRTQQVTNILLVNHQIRSEALGILFDKGKFVVELSNQQMALLSTLTNTQDFAFFKAPKSIKKIKNIIVEVYMEVEAPSTTSWYHYVQALFILDNMRSVCYALSANSVLQSLEVSFWHYHSTIDWSRHSCGTPQETAIPSFFQYSASFNDFAGPISWLRVSREVDFKEKQEFYGLNDALESLKTIILSGTPAKCPSQLEMMWIGLKNKLTDYDLRGMNGEEKFPLCMCMWASSTGSEDRFVVAQTRTMEMIRKHAQALSHGNRSFSSTAALT